MLLTLLKASNPHIKVFDPDVSWQSTGQSLISGYLRTTIFLCFLCQQEMMATPAQMSEEY
jgi:hypothetical protein